MNWQTVAGAGEVLLVLVLLAGLWWLMRRGDHDERLWPTHMLDDDEDEE